MIFITWPVQFDGHGLTLLGGGFFYWPNIVNIAVIFTVHVLINEQITCQLRKQILEYWWHHNPETILNIESSLGLVTPGDSHTFRKCWRFIWFCYYFGSGKHLFYFLMVNLIAVRAASFRKQHPADKINPQLIVCSVGFEVVVVVVLAEYCTSFIKPRGL